MRSTCLVAATWVGQLGLDRVGQLRAGRDQHRGGDRVVLGLADQVGGDVRRVGGVVGEDRDLGRAGLGVDADAALEQPLGRRRPRCCRARSPVDRRRTASVPYANIATAWAPPTA